jgi:hypothetical protein
MRALHSPQAQFLVDSARLRRRNSKSTILDCTADPDAISAAATILLYQE